MKILMKLFALAFSLGLLGAMACGTGGAGGC